MTIEGWIVLAVLLGALVVMGLDWIGPQLAMGLCLGIFILSGILEPGQALAGFANPAVATVALLLIMGLTLERSHWIKWMAGILFGKRGGRLSLLRGLPTVAAISAFLANTPVVAALIPSIKNWARSTDESPSRFLLPIAIASTLGGTCTLIGTTPNLVVDGLLRTAGDPGLSIFEMARMGVPLALISIVYLSFAGYAMLPIRKDPVDQLERNPRQFVSRLTVVSGSSLADRPVEDLRHLQNLFLAGIERDDRLISAVSPEVVILTGDVLIFVGLIDCITELTTRYGLAAAEMEDHHHRIFSSGKAKLVEAVVSQVSPLVGRTIRDSGFRGHYNAVVIAVHRHGEQVTAKIGDIVPHPGDTLLLLTSSRFIENWQYSPDFYFVSPITDLQPEIHRWDWIEPIVLGCVVITAATGLLSLLESLMAGVIVLVGLGRLRTSDIWKNLSWPTLFIIATSIGIGNAMTEAGIANAIGVMLNSLPGTISPVMVVGIILLMTALLTEVIHNVAAAALMFPLAWVTTQTLGMDPHMVAVTVAFGASACFASPIGYHTNAMVAGAAGYTFRDFLRVCIPLKLI